MRVFLCEKPSQGRDIARVVGAAQKGLGCMSGDGVAVTWAIGHLLEMAEPDAYGEQYRHWSIEHLPIVPQEWRYRLKPKVHEQHDAVMRLLRQASEVVIATDADREGETIARELLDAADYRGRVQRMWFAALDEASLKKALANLLPGEQTAPLYQAGLGRARADWLVGMNLTRLYTRLAQAAGYTGVTSVGRVQTPTLALVVARDRLIESFVPLPYFDMQVTVAVAAGTFTGNWVVPETVADPDGRCLDRALAETAARRVQGQIGRILTAETRRRSEAAPLPFTLSDLQQEASRRHGMGAQQVLDLAQVLYERYKLITYPRTDCPYLPPSQHADAVQVLAALRQTDPAMASLVAMVDPACRGRVWNAVAVEASAHHGIIPTAQAGDLGALSASERSVYDLIRRRYLAQFCPDFEYDETRVTAEVAGERFRASGRIERVSGWKAVLGEARIGAPTDEAAASRDTLEDTGEDAATSGRQPLPMMQTGEACRTQAARVLDRQTQPPPRYTEGTLIAAMKSVARLVTDARLKAVLKETSGIGTEATRAAILETLLQRDYVQRQGRKGQLVSTPSGRMLIDVLPAAVRDPATTALWEQALDDIAQGRCTLDAFLERQTAWVRSVIEQVRTRLERGESLIPASALPVHACPVCGKPLRRLKNGRQGQGFFWQCTDTESCKATAPDVAGKPGNPGEFVRTGKRGRTARKHAEG